MDQQAGRKILDNLLSLAFYSTRDVATGTIRDYVHDMTSHIRQEIRLILCSTIFDEVCSNE